MLPQDASGSSQRLLFDIGPITPADFLDEPADQQTRPVRQLVTTRDERKAVYLNTQRLYVGKSGDVLKVKEKDKVVQEIRLKDVSQVNLMGAVQVSTQAVQGLMRAEIPLLYFSMGGWFYGMTQSVGLKNIMWRREQFRLADDERFCLRLAKKIVAGKIRNQRTLLMRNHVEPPADALRFMKAIMGEVERTDSLASLLGIEGVAARSYFENFAGMLKVGRSREQDDDLAFDQLKDSTLIRFDFQKRNRRPPRDPVNALLSLGYSLLSKDLTVACAAVGLDPYLGYYHQPRFGRPALALDLMEPFRPLVVDSAVLTAINQRMVTEKHFQQAGESVALTPQGRKAFFQAYEQRMDQLVTHPLFGYRVSYRRILEIQVRLLARLLTGEIGYYPVFVTR
jgi:CRISPR-associated protein Cas1